MRPEPYDIEMDKKATTTQIPEQSLTYSLSQDYILVKDTHNNTLLDDALKAIKPYFDDYLCHLISKDHAKGKIQQRLHTDYGKDILDLLERDGCVAKATDQHCSCGKPSYILSDNLYCAGCHKYLENCECEDMEHYCKAHDQIFKERCFVCLFEQAEARIEAVQVK